MQNTIVFPKAPLQNFSNTGILNFFRLFKYEIIKILVFLMIFIASLYYVNSESKIYYGGSKSVSGKL
jgi:hypothetical protein